MGIVFTSEGCMGCATEGVDMTLTGSIFEDPTPMCKTVGLDNPMNIDYASRGVFEAEEQEIGWGWGTCYQSALTGLTQQKQSWFQFVETQWELPYQMESLLRSN